jgi:cytochrome oxidase Cu insertion factor (SCO1/SenC/PrrC family)
MRQTRLAILIIAFLTFSIVPAHAQLGPKEGENLKPTDLERIKMGDTAPDFTLENMDGKQIAFSNFRGKKNVVLVFYRGHW